MAPISSVIHGRVHHAAALHDLPVLFIIMNNAMWNAVRHFTTVMYPRWPRLETQ